MFVFMKCVLFALVVTCAGAFDTLSESVRKTRRKGAVYGR